MELICVWFLGACIAYNLISCFCVWIEVVGVILFGIGLVFCGFVLDYVTLLCFDCCLSCWVP